MEGVNYNPEKQKDIEHWGEKICDIKLSCKLSKYLHFRGKDG